MPDAFLQVFDDPGKPFRVAKQPLPDDLQEGEVLVRIDLASICGSDLHTITGKRRGPTPAVLGHEGVGRVIATGAARNNLKSGDRVTWTLTDSCGICPFCRDHRLPEKCKSLFKYGHAEMVD